MKYVQDTQVRKEDRKLKKLASTAVQFGLFTASTCKQTHTHTHFLLSAGLVERRNLLSKLHEVSGIFGFMEHLCVWRQTVTQLQY